MPSQASNIRWKERLRNKMERKGKVPKGRRKGCFGMFYTKSYNWIKKKKI